MHPPPAAGPRIDGVVVVVACVGQKEAKRETSPEVGLEPTTSILCYSRSGLKVQRSNQLSYLCLFSTGSDRYFCRVQLARRLVRFSRTRTLRMLIFSASEKPGGSMCLRVVGEDPQRADAEPAVSRRCVVFRQAHGNLGGNGRARALLLRAIQAVLAARRRRQGSTHGGRRE